MGQCDILWPALRRGRQDQLAHYLQNKASITFEKEFHRQRTQNKSLLAQHAIAFLQLIRFLSKQTQSRIISAGDRMFSGLFAQGSCPPLERSAYRPELLLGNAPKCTSSTCCFHSPMLSQWISQQPFRGIRFPAGLGGCSYNNPASALRCTCMAAICLL